MRPAVWLLCLNLFIPAETTAQQTVWRTSVGLREATLGLTWDRDPNGRDRYDLEISHRGYTDFRVSGTISLPNFPQHPGMGFRVDHRTLQPSVLLLSFGDNKQPFDWPLFIDQRVIVAVADKVEATHESEIYALMHEIRRWYLGQSQSVAVAEEYRSFSADWWVIVRVHGLGFVRPSIGLLYEEKRAGRAWDSDTYFSIGMRFDRVLTRIR